MSKTDTFESYLDELNRLLSMAEKYKDYLSQEQKALLREKLIVTKSQLDTFRKRLGEC